MYIYIIHYHTTFLHNSQLFWGEHFCGNSHCFWSLSGWWLSDFLWKVGVPYSQRTPIQWGENPQHSFPLIIIIIIIILILYSPNHFFFPFFLQKTHHCHGQKSHFQTFLGGLFPEKSPMSRKCKVMDIRLIGIILICQIFSSSRAKDSRKNGRLCSEKTQGFEMFFLAKTWDHLSLRLTLMNSVVLLLMFQYVNVACGSLCWFHSQKQ